MSSSQLQTRARIAGASARRLVDASTRCSSYALLCLFLFGATTLWFRHEAMALQHPLDGRSLFLAGLLAAGAAATARSLSRRTAILPGSEPRPKVFEPLLSLSLIAWGVALSLPNLKPGGMFLLWSSLLVEEAWAWWTGVRRVPPLASSRFGHGTDSPAELGGAKGPSPLPSETKGRDVADLPRMVNEPNVFQEFVRSRDPMGEELLRGWVRVPFAPGQRIASVHLAFCPPFGSAPTLDIVQQFGPEGRIKVVQVLPLGARLDVKLHETSPNDASVILEVLAKAPGPTDDARR